MNKNLQIEMAYAQMKSLIMAIAIQEARDRGKVIISQHDGQALQALTILDVKVRIETLMDHLEDV